MDERLDDAAVRERLARLDELLAQVEQIPGPSGELALEAVSALAAVYGEALARAVEYAGRPGVVVEAMVGDELLGHLLALHGAHPDPPERRVTRVLEQLRPAVRQRGGDVELVGIEGGVATVRLTAGGCGSTAAGIEEAVREAVLAVAPELEGVRREQAPREATFVPLDALLRRPSVVWS
jgi:Fe-S cluster biogenesis protein NfuA